MSLDLHFELRLEERQADRVFVSVVLAPFQADSTVVDGVSVQVEDRSGEALGTRLVLPLSGEVHQPLLTTVEVRARAGIPPGARVVGVAWRGQEQQEASCPCDPGTQLEVHMRGKKLVGLGGVEKAIHGLQPLERAALGRAMPWIDKPAVDAEKPPAVLENPGPTVEEVAGEAAETYGLDEEDAAFLAELLGED